MTHTDETHELTRTKLKVSFVATCRRLMLTAAVLRDNTEPWLGGGRAKEIIESSESDAEAICEVCEKLLKYMQYAQTVLEINSAAVNEYSSLRRQVLQDSERTALPKPQDMAEKLLALASDGARELEVLIRGFWNSPAEWCGSKALAEGDEHLHMSLRFLDYMRWQIIKEFARLVSIFDDHDDPESDEPCEAWQRDREAIIAADIKDV